MNTQPSALASGCAAFKLGFPTSCLSGGAHGVLPKNIIARHHENLLDFVEQGKIMEAEAPTVRVDVTPTELISIVKLYRKVQE